MVGQQVEQGPIAVTYLTAELATAAALVLARALVGFFSLVDLTATTKALRAARHRPAHAAPAGEHPAGMADPRLPVLVPRGWQCLVGTSG